MEQAFIHLMIYVIRNSTTTNEENCFFKNTKWFCFLFIYLLLAVLGLCCCACFSLVGESRGYAPVVVGRLLIARASLVVEHGLWGVWASVVVAGGLCGCGSRL